MFRLRTVVLLSLCLSAAAGLARAQTVKAADSLTSRFIVNSAAVAAKPAAPSSLRYATLHSPLPEGIVRTSVEKRFGLRDTTVGEAGFLCGLLPHPDTSGAAAAYGHDPDGRFVGAKLRLSF